MVEYTLPISLKNVCVCIYIYTGTQAGTECSLPIKYWYSSWDGIQNLVNPYSLKPVVAANLTRDEFAPTL